jgi:hypothetical protein
MTDSDDDEAFDNEVKAVEYAIGRLAENPGAVAAACLQGLVPTAIDIIAGAPDDTLEEIVGPYGGLDALKALRFMCGAFLKLRQAKRLTDMWGE